MTLKGTNNTAAFQDADMEKLSSMLEPLDDVETTDLTTPESSDAPAMEAPTEEAMPTEPTTTPEEATPEDAGIAPEGEAKQADVMEGDELEQFLKELEGAGQEADTAAAKVDEAVAGGDTVAIADALEKERIANAEKDTIINRLTTQLKLQIEGGDKLIEEKFLLESDMREKTKIYDLVSSDDALKSLVVLKNKADTDPTFKDRYVNLLRDMYEQASGVTVQGLLDDARKTEKSGMSQGSYMAAGSTPTDEIAGGMLEKI